MRLFKFCLKWIATLTIIFILPILAIRTQSYSDRIAAALIDEKCSPPCFIGIHSGRTSMSESYYLLAAHDWIANGPDDFPSVIRQAVFYGAGVARTVVKLDWALSAPKWIDETQPGSVLVENYDVLGLSISTRLLLGELILGFGNPDEVRFLAVDNLEGRFEYSAWYAQEGMFVTAQGFCPLRYYYGLPAKISFRMSPPALSEVTSQQLVCQ